MSSCTGDDYQRDCERMLRDGAVAVFNDGRRTGYIYHEGSLYCLVEEVDGEYRGPRRIGSNRRDRIFADNIVRPKSPQNVPGPVAAVSRGKGE